MPMTTKQDETQQKRPSSTGIEMQNIPSKSLFTQLQKQTPQQNGLLYLN
jgi:hypothetical protein